MNKAAATTAMQNGLTFTNFPHVDSEAPTTRLLFLQVIRICMLIFLRGGIGAISGGLILLNTLAAELVIPRRR
ncbi:hypothetical protein [Qipengyuania sp.]|uniref:hypothetical protein n=1 Tax=Qipengyuania sp. TaxID=2004515 RepID=UPI0035C7E557